MQHQLRIVTLTLLLSFSSCLPGGGGSSSSPDADAVSADATGDIGEEGDTTSPQDVAGQDMAGEQTGDTTMPPDGEATDTTTPPADTTPPEDTTPPDDTAEGMGYVTGLPLACSASDLDGLTAAAWTFLLTESPDGIIDQVETMVAEHTNADGELDPAEMRSAIALTAVLGDNVLPFCWSALTSLQAEPEDPYVLNLAAVCLLELDDVSGFGQLLDCAYVADPGLSLTHANGATYHQATGNPSTAITFLQQAAALAQAGSSFYAWDGYEYAYEQGDTGAAGGFQSQIPSNFPLELSGGAEGTAEPITPICCACTGKTFDDVGKCVNECEATMGCFSGICDPAACCAGNNPLLGIGLSLCFPPAGIQVCGEINTNGTFEVTAGVDIPGLGGAWGGAQYNFKSGSTTFLVKGADALGQSVTVDETGNIGYTLGLSATTPIGKIGVSVGTSQQQIKDALKPACQ